MLDFGRGAREVTVDDDQRLMVFPDFTDPGLFYYVPNNPHLATMPDGSLGIRMLVYRQNLDEIGEDEEDAVAFLSLDVDVSWPAEVIEQAANALRMSENLQETPRLVPIFFREGSVKLMLLDAQTPDPDSGQPAGEAEPTEFVTSILGAGSPSLYGDNRAIFQAKLSKKGAAALSGALDGVTPIGVVYSLTFAGMQPAFNVRARVEWQKLYDHFSEQKHLDLIFYESDIQKSIDTLVEEKAIELEVTVQGVGEAAMDAEREKVMESVRQLIFDQFFEATFEREDPAGGSTADDVVDTMTKIHQNALTLGIGYTYRRKEVKVEELRSLNLDWTARRAAERTIYPQAHMHNLLTDSGITEDQLITIVDGSDDLWRTLPIQVTAAAAWEADAIAGITVDVEYDDADGDDTHHWSVFLDKDNDSAVKRDWMDRTSGNRFRYKYQVVFRDEGITGPRPTVDSGEEWLEHEGTILVLHPRELYDAKQLEVAAVPNFPFTRWPAVQAMVRYRDDTGFEFLEDQVLTAAQPKLETRFRVDRGHPSERLVRLLYIGDSGERIDTEWMPMPQDQWVVEDPHASTLSVRALVSGDRANVANLIVDLEYRDDDKGIHETGFLEFSGETIAKSQVWTINLADPTKRRYRYRVTLVTQTGDFLETGWISTEAPTLAVGENAVRRLTVEMMTGELDPGITGVEVALRYHNQDSGQEQVQTFQLGADSRAEWRVELQDATQRHYELTTTWISEDGFNRQVGPETRSDTLLVIPGGPPDNN